MGSLDRLDVGVRQGHEGELQAFTPEQLEG